MIFDEIVKDERLNNLYNQFKEVLYYSQHIDKTEDLPYIENIFEIWYNEKQLFMDVFNANNNFIYETDKELTFPLDLNSKKESFEMFLSFIQETALRNFLVEQGVDAFFDNCVKETTYINYRDITISKGTKLLKAIKFFIEDKDRLTDIQNYASRILQENKITGKLCLSINPLDYLSVSENCHNWRSCHALDGEYRAGNLSYIMDSTTVVAYLKSDTDKKLPHFPESVLWNDKKWRVLLYFSADRKFCIAGKQYPCEIKSLFNKIRDIFINNNILDTRSKEWETTTYGVTEWCNDYLDFFTRFGEKLPIQSGYFLSYDGKIIHLSDVVEDAPYSKQYNDIIYSTTYKKPYYIYTYNTTFNPMKDICQLMYKQKILVGAMTRCLKCKKVLDKEDSMLCDDCVDDVKYDNGVWQCDYCKGVFSKYTVDKYTVENKSLCADCYDETTEICDHCGYTGFRENFIYSTPGGWHSFCCEQCQINYMDDDEEEEE